MRSAPPALSSPAPFPPSSAPAKTRTLTKGTISSASAKTLSSILVNLAKRLGTCGGWRGNEERQLTRDERDGPLFV
ncbi:hypothetical protein E2C01_096858 [Portunus trituberculatus]|uniref:Uncharacterized protein n=1 Tax=Portunus trituberculatus TaxID=210409 RepID=A0A5B7K471_PORTR|nr:hypothetical protein [Portunus trituberculatus]